MPYELPDPLTPPPEPSILESLFGAPLYGVAAKPMPPEVLERFVRATRAETYSYYARRRMQRLPFRLSRAIDDVKAFLFGDA
jgi:hypothetical protein